MITSKKKTADTKFSALTRWIPLLTMLQKAELILYCLCISNCCERKVRWKIIIMCPVASLSAVIFSSPIPWRPRGESHSLTTVAAFWHLPENSKYNGVKQGSRCIFHKSTVFACQIWLLHYHNCTTWLEVYLKGKFNIASCIHITLLHILLKKNWTAYFNLQAVRHGVKYKEKPNQIKRQHTSTGKHRNTQVNESSKRAEIPTHN